MKPRQLVPFFLFLCTILLLISLCSCGGSVGASNSNTPPPPPPPPASATVDLDWDPSSSVVDGYNVYRSTFTGGPYAKLNQGLVLSTTYADSTAQRGTTYFYVTTAVDSANVESGYSNEARADIPQ